MLRCAQHDTALPYYCALAIEPDERHIPVDVTLNISFLERHHVLPHTMVNSRAIEKSPKSRSTLSVGQVILAFPPFLAAEGGKRGLLNHPAAHIASSLQSNPPGLYFFVEII
jgi:hypothetical protein